ncbi:T9SS type A sorting domain-containing protein [Psychroserpens ponticola]|uniref:T9SS type A sorting domain-containing protein n=1 Tax=Psychroserpens ponticola TaxID=2932268 RepID=A0ABY7RXR5_9FLAO|nr:T9SS type A sorting domain-containing protein [Psychroserpens ponticola]WCO00495.1 T9SS type A sorting domain-containing protein [Psychroserpens ponticola]
MKKITLLFVVFTQIIIAQNYTEYTTGSATDISTNHEFGICMMGGASENDDAMIWFLNKANGGDVVVLRASGSDGYNDYFYSDLGVTINSVTTFVINNEAGATNPYVLQKVANAEAIWFAGGDQFDYVSYFKDNDMEDTLNSFINTKRGVIGGTSAGMAILGGAYFSAENGTVTNAQALSNPYHNRMKLGYNDFLEIPFLEHVITDTHYDDPDRRARHAAFLARYATDNNTRAFGIACNEYTAVCIDNIGRAYVYGEYPDYPEFAYFLQSNCIDDFMPETCVDGQALTWNQGGEAIKVAKIPGLYSAENYIDLTDWSNSQGVVWENWSVINGVFSTSSTVNPECDLLSVTENDNLKVFVGPNPFQDVLTIESQLYEFNVKLYDSFGKLIAQYKNLSQIDTSSLSSGLYFMRVSSEGLQETFKLIKH